MGQHSTLSPSSAERWIACPPSVFVSAGIEDEGSKYAVEGSAMHALAAAVLTTGAAANAASWVGWYYNVETDTLVRDEPLADSVQIDGDMATLAQGYVDTIRVYAAGGTLLVEQKTVLPLDVPEGVEPQSGTSDAVILTADRTELQVHDLKTGRGVVVHAERNPQLMLYAWGEYNKLRFTEDIDTIRVVIHQPRVSSAPAEWSCSVDELLAWAKDTVQPAARKVWDIIDTGIVGPDDFHPSDKGCRWCKALPTCEAAQKHAEGLVGADFENLDKTPELAAATPAERLGALFTGLDFLESWIKAVRSVVETRLLAGDTIPGLKLVRGRRGARQWGDNADAVEKQLKAMRVKLDEMYDFKLVSPPALEKRLMEWIDADGIKREPVLGPRQWDKIKTQIVQPEGGISVALASDKREAYVPDPVTFEPVASSLLD
jgi:hypothetical protein